ncbi:Golgin subfamily A member 1 isoform X2 [Oopsacas minuta]|uniref:Golgin subfamily A member 1 isoform X2 n=1 Tax=Oopsacas minuta TaxID=111878 RepID=A0AAV7KBV8_9METZ|nr:Golgin subfamily A member 1 isoform X2 [Oopsacas minuta]
MFQKVKEQWNSVDTDSLKKSVSGYLTRSPQAQADISDKDSVSSDKTPSITELSEASDPDLSRGRSRTLKSRELQELETRLEEQVKLKNRLADMLEQQQDKAKAESREVKRNFELKLQEQNSKLNEEMSKKDKFLDKSKLVIQELSKEVQEIQNQNDITAQQHAMELEKCRKESDQSTVKIKQLEAELQGTRDGNESLKQKCFGLEYQINKLSLIQEDNIKQTKELSAMRDVIQNSTDESEQKYQLLLEQLTGERDELKREYSALQQQHTDTQRDSSVAKRELESTLHTLGTDLTEYKNKIIKLEREKDKFIQEKNTQISTLEKELDKSKKELNQTREKSIQEQNGVEKSLVEAKQLLQAKEQEIVRLSGEGERQLLQISKLQKDSDRNVQELKSSLHKERTSVDELRTLVEQVKLEKAHGLESIYATHDEEKQGLIDQNSELKQQAKATQEQLVAVTSSSLTAHQKYKNELTKVEKEKKSMEEQVMKVKNERVELQQKCLELEKGIKALRISEEGWVSQFEEMTNKQDKDKKEIERLEVMVDLFNKELSTSKKDSQDKQVGLQTQLSLNKQQQEQERAEMLQSVDGLHNQIKILDQTILANTEKSQKLNIQLEQVQGDSQQIQASLQSEVDRLNNKVIESEHLLSEAISTRDDSLIELNTAKQMIEHKNDNLKAVIQERNNLQTQVAEKQHELVTSVNQGKEFSNLNNVLTQQLDEVSDKINSLRTALQEGVDGMQERVTGKLRQVESNLVGIEGCVTGLWRMRDEMKELRSNIEMLQRKNSEYQEKLQKKVLENKQLQQRQYDLKKVMSRELKIQSSQSDISLQEQQAVSSDTNGTIDSTPILPIDYLPNRNVTPVIRENNQNNPLPTLRSNSMLILPTLEPDLIDLSIQSPLTEINFQYLRNIMLQYMCSTPVEAKQLHKALFTILSVSKKEQESINQFWSYRESWFGYKAPPKFRSIVPESKEL